MNPGSPGLCDCVLAGVNQARFSAAGKSASCFRIASTSSPEKPAPTIMAFGTSEEVAEFDPRPDKGWIGLLSSRECSSVVAWLVVLKTVTTTSGQRTIVVNNLAAVSVFESVTFEHVAFIHEFDKSPRKVWIFATKGNGKGGRHATGAAERCEMSMKDAAHLEEEWL